MATTKKYDTIIFDGSNAAHRTASAVVPLTNARGDRVEVVFGLLRLLSSVMRLNPSRTCDVVWDGVNSRKLRQAIDPVYKSQRDSNRTEEDKERIAGMHVQVATFWELFGQYLPITWHISEKYEADDIMAMIANCREAVYQKSLIVSGDGDMLQLVSKFTTVFSPTRNNHCTVDNFAEYTKGYPNGQAWLFSKCLQGEPPTGDNIPGIKGLGEVWAKRLLETHGWSLFNVMNNLDPAVAKSKLGKAICCVEGLDRISKNYKLMSLRGHNRYQTAHIETRVGKLNKLKLQTNMAKMQFSSLLVSFNQFINPFMALEKE